MDVEEDHFGMALESLSMVYAVHASGVSLTMSTNPASTFASAYKSRQKVAEKTLEKTTSGSEGAFPGGERGRREAP